MSTLAQLSPMVALAGGAFTMGSGDFYPEERPAHRASVGPFEIDVHPVTNAEFAAFVGATGYVTVAERPLNGPEFARLPAAERVPGSIVFTPTPGPVDLRDWRQWWRWIPGAHWRQPGGVGTSIDERLDHPVVQVAAEDAESYAAWVGKRLPTEREWEFAAWGGRDGQRYAWGEQEPSEAFVPANTWHGVFPYRNSGARGWVGTSPVGSFEANGFGLFDVCGNVWEWTATAFTPNHMLTASTAVVADSSVTTRESECGCGHSGRPTPATAAEDVPALIDLQRPRVTKGGSYLCAPSYCQRYRPAARSLQTPDSSTTHLGFRCAR